MKKNGTVSIFILIDALGWEYIKDRPFLRDIVVTKQSVKSILGFSSGVIPSIITGKLPEEHTHWSLYFNSPKTSPFRWTKYILLLPERILRSRVVRKMVEEISKRCMGYTGYFETYLIPIRLLCYFDISEHKNIYAPGGIRSGESIFDILKKEKVDHCVFTYPIKDSEIFKKAINDLENSQSRFYFLYCSEFDAFAHCSCKDKEAIQKRIDYYEKSIREVYETAKNNFEDVKLYVFSDHGMAPINESYNLKSEVEKLGFSAPKDYIPFYDSTMARFWFFNPKAREGIVSLLKKKPYGRILSDEELRRYGAYFYDQRYGEVIFLMKTGAVINPSFMGSKAPGGMHGFDPNDRSMDAVLVSNQKIEKRIHDVRGFFTLMVDAMCNTQYSIPKIRVLYFLNSIVRGGVEEHVLRLVGGLDKNKFEPILVLPQKLIEAIGDDLNKLGIRYYPLTLRRWHQLGEISNFINILKKEKPDIVHSHLFFATQFAAPLSKISGVPCVIDTAHIREAWRKGIKKAYFIDRFFYKFVDKIIAVSKAVEMYLINEKGVSARKIEVIYNGIDTNTYTPVRREGNGKLNIGVIGRLEPQKGHKYFLEAVQMLGDKGKNAAFMIAGDGALRSELEALSSDLKINDRVKFLGFRKDIKGIMAGLDLIILPSLYEGLPLVVLEAGAMGKPVIATDVDGSSEAIMDKHTGLLVPSKNSKALRDAIQLLLSDKDLCVRYGENARRRIGLYFDIKKQIQDTQILYDELLESKNILS